MWHQQEDIFCSDVIVGALLYITWPLWTSINSEVAVYLVMKGGILSVGFFPFFQEVKQVMVPKPQIIGR